MQYHDQSLQTLKLGKKQNISLLTTALYYKRYHANLTEMI